MKLAIVSGAAIALALSVSAPASAANLVTNGGFETGDFSGWTVDAGGGCVSGCGTNTAPVVIPYGSGAGYPNGAFGEAIGPNALPATSGELPGNNVAYFSSDTATQTLSQNVNLVGGKTYRIGFDYYAPANGISNPNDASLKFLINGVAVNPTLTAGSGSGTPAQQWLRFETTFASGPGGPANYKFEFKGLGNTAADFAIDRVYAMVPEPSTWAMMILGIGFAGVAMRRRQTVSLKYA